MELSLSLSLSSWSGLAAADSLRLGGSLRSLKEGNESTMLLMPAWDPGDNAGVKVVTVSPNNSKYNLPSIQGIYLLFDVQKGLVRAIVDAKALTNKRTAAASSVAACARNCINLLRTWIVKEPFDCAFSLQTSYPRRFPVSIMLAR